MKFIIFVLLNIVFISSFSQDIPKADSVSHQKKFLVISSSLLYNTHFGEKRFEYTPSAIPSYNGSNYYTNCITKNTFGGNLGMHFRQSYNQKHAIQQGAIVEYITERYKHNDSTKNPMNSFLNYHEDIMFSVSYSFLYHYSINRFTFASGIIHQLFENSRYKYVFDDESTSTHSGRFYKGNFYFSENIQYRIMKKYNSYLNLGATISTENFEKYNKRYNVVLNMGLVFLVEKKQAKTLQGETYYR